MAQKEVSLILKMKRGSTREQKSCRRRHCDLTRRVSDIHARQREITRRRGENVDTFIERNLRPYIHAICI